MFGSCPPTVGTLLNEDNGARLTTDYRGAFVQCRHRQLTAAWTAALGVLDAIRTATIVNRYHSHRAAAGRNRVRSAAAVEAALVQAESRCLRLANAVVFEMNYERNTGRLDDPAASGTLRNLATIFVPCGDHFR